MSEYKGPNNADGDFTHKGVLLTNISLGFAFAWPFVGLILMVYVRSQTKDPSMKSNNGNLAFWLTGLALFYMWLLWFCMFASQMNPQLRVFEKSEK